MTGRDLYLSCYPRAQSSILLFSSGHFSRFLFSRSVLISFQHDIHCLSWRSQSIPGQQVLMGVQIPWCPAQCLWLGWCSVMHCDDLEEGEQGSLAHKSWPLRLLGVSAWPVNLTIEERALSQTARPLTKLYKYRAATGHFSEETDSSSSFFLYFDLWKAFRIRTFFFNLPERNDVDALFQWKTK